jgi:hypothetical protein
MNTKRSLNSVVQLSRLERSQVHNERRICMSSEFNGEGRDAARPASSLDRDINRVTMIGSGMPMRYALDTYTQQQVGQFAPHTHPVHCSRHVGKLNVSRAAFGNQLTVNIYH